MVLVVLITLSFAGMEYRFRNMDGECDFSFVSNLLYFFFYMFEIFSSSSDYPPSTSCCFLCSTNFWARPRYEWERVRSEGVDVEYTRAPFTHVRLVQSKYRNAQHCCSMLTFARFMSVQTKNEEMHINQESKKKKTHPNAAEILVQWQTGKKICTRIQKIARIQ